MILAIVGAAVAASMLLLGQSINHAVSNAATCMNSGTAVGC
jgi:hypothetical protein